MLKKITALKNHRGFQRYFKNSAWMISEQVLRMVAGVLVGIWVARYLGPEQFGAFSYAIAFTALFSSIAKLGLDGIVVRELVNQPEKQDVYLATAFWMKLVGAVIAMFLVALVLPWTSSDRTTSLYIFIIASGLFFQSFQVVDFYFQAQILAKYISISKVIQLFFSSLIKIYLVLTSADLVWFVWVILYDQLMLAITYSLAYRYHKSKFLPLNRFDFSVGKTLIKDSFPLILSSIAVVIYMRIDQIMIKEMLGEYEVGIYSAAVRLSEVWYFIPMLISSSLFPAIINARKSSLKLYNQRLQRLYTFMVWIAIAIAIPLTFMSDQVVTLLYGKNYILVADVLSMHIWSGVFVFLGVGFGRYLIAENLSQIYFYRTLAGATVNIILNLFFIPLYGIFGAAISTFIAQVFANYVYDFFDKRLHTQLKIKTKAIFMPQKAFY